MTSAHVPYSCVCGALGPLQVGVFRRGKYAGGKKIGKGNVANVGDTVKKGQTLGYVEQLGTFVEVKVGYYYCDALSNNKHIAGGFVCCPIAISHVLFVPCWLAGCVEQLL